MTKEDKSLGEMRRDAFVGGCAPALGVLTAEVSAFILGLALNTLGVQWLWNDFVVAWFGADSITFKQALIIYVLFDAIGADYGGYQLRKLLKEHDPDRDYALEALGAVTYCVIKLIVIAAFVTVF